MSETQEEYDKRQLKRKVRALQKATGMKYTTALRVIEAGPSHPDHPDYEPPVETTNITIVRGDN